jgi:hypothetical protein
MTPAAVEAPAGWRPKRPSRARCSRPAVGIFDQLGWVELIYNHIKAKVPGPEHHFVGVPGRVTCPPHSRAATPWRLALLVPLSLVRLLMEAPPCASGDIAAMCRILWPAPKHQACPMC